jgi:hypothetical protein
MPDRSYKVFHVVFHTPHPYGLRPADSSIVLYFPINIHL